MRAPRREEKKDGGGDEDDDNDGDSRGTQGLSRRKKEKWK